MTDKQAEVLLRTLENATAQFTAAQYRFALRTREPLLLPPFKGFALRGGFGYAFRKAVCSTRRNECPGCLVEKSCPYAYLFETTAGDEEVATIPRPFLFEPPLEKRTVYETGEEISFGLTLFGKGQDFLPYFVLAFQMLGEMGLGKTRAKFELERVTAISYMAEEKEIYHRENGALRSEHYPITWEMIKRRSQDFAAPIEIWFLTPARLKADAHFQTNITFELFVRTLLRRFTQLVAYHNHLDGTVNYKKIIRLAAMVDSRAATPWSEMERFSRRQQTRMKMGGITGTMVVNGENLPAFLPLLLWGEIIHVGKNTVFGLGQMKVVSGSEKSQANVTWL